MLNLKFSNGYEISLGNDGDTILGFCTTENGTTRITCNSVDELLSNLEYIKCQPGVISDKSVR